MREINSVWRAGDRTLKPACEITLMEETKLSFEVLLTVHLSIILVINHFNA